MKGVGRTWGGDEKLGRVVCIKWKDDP
jgi:hypothetical protein